MPAIVSAGQERSIKLPPPRLNGGGTLMQALQSRAGLGCVVRGLVDRRKLAPMGLRRDQRIVLAQTVGFAAA